MMAYIRLGRLCSCTLPVIGNDHSLNVLSWKIHSKGYRHVRLKKYRWQVLIPSVFSSFPYGCQHVQMLQATGVWYLILWRNKCWMMFLLFPLTPDGRKPYIAGISMTYILSYWSPSDQQSLKYFVFLMQHYLSWLQSRKIQKADFQEEVSTTISFFHFSLFLYDAVP